MNRTRGKLPAGYPAGAERAPAHCARAAPHRLPVGGDDRLSTATQPRVALVHDFLLDVRGAERVFLELCAMWPEADIFTAVYDEEGTEGRFADRNVHTSFLQRLRPIGADLPGAAAALSGGDRVVRPVRLRPGRLQLLGLGARGAVRRGHGPRELLPQPVPLRVERSRQHAGPPPQPGHPRRSCGPPSAAGASGTGSRRSGPTATSPTRGPPRRGSAPTSGARPSRPPAGRHRRASRPGRSATTTRSSPS